MNLPINKQRCNSYNRLACLLNLHANLDIVCIRNILNFGNLLFPGFCTVKTLMGNIKVNN